MSTSDFIIALFCHVDDALPTQRLHPQAKLWPSEVVTLGVLRVLKGLSFHAFHRWVERNLTDLFPHLPDRTRLLRLLHTYCHLADHFLAKARGNKTVGFIDCFGIESAKRCFAWLHPRREGRSPHQYAKKGKSNHRWIVGAKFCPLLDSKGQIKGQILEWRFGQANLHDTAFVGLVAQHPTVRVLADTGFHRSDKRGGDPSNLIICGRGEENGRMLIETVFSLWTNVLAMKKTTTRTEPHLEALLAFAVAAYNIIINWTGKTKLETTFFSL